MNTDSNSSPFTVPEGFFEQAGKRAEASVTRIVRTRRIALSCACAVLLVAVIFPIAGLQKQSEMDILAANYEYQMSLDSYDYDVFLDNMSLSE